MLSAISKKLSLSPRPLRRQAATEGSKPQQCASLVSPYDTPESSPNWLRRSFPPALTALAGGSTRESSFESNPDSPQPEIQIVVDPSSPQLQRRKLTRQTHSEPINPGLLGVHRMNTIDIVDHRSGDESDSGASATSLSPLSPPSPTPSSSSSAKSLPASPVTSPGSKRKYGSWRHLHRPRLRKAVSDVARGARSTATLLRSRKLSSFEADAAEMMMEEGQEYYIVGAEALGLDMEVEVGCAFSHCFCCSYCSCFSLTVIVKGVDENTNGHFRLSAGYLCAHIQKTSGLGRLISKLN